MHLQGLTHEDTLLCDLLWNCESLAAVEAMIAALPPAHQRRARLMVELMTAAAFDEHMDVEDNVKDYLSSL